MSILSQLLTPTQKEELLIILSKRFFNRIMHTYKEHYIFSFEKNAYRKCTNMKHSHIKGDDNFCDCEVYIKDWIVEAQEVLTKEEYYEVLHKAFDVEM